MKLSAQLTLILALMICAGCAVSNAAKVRESVVYAATDASFESFLRENVEKEHFSGVALVMQQGQLLHAQGYGYASDGKPNQVSTPFHVASITKQFTAAAIMLLVESGSVSLNGSINEYLPLSYRASQWNDVTVHHLLSHSSGIVDYAVSRDYYQLEKGFFTDETVDEVIREAMSKDLEFIPGTQYAYSNVGYTLLGFIIEQKTKSLYGGFVERYLLLPMGMRSSRIHVVGRDPVPGEAEGFRWDDQQERFVTDNVETLPATLPDAGLVTTLNDFVNWMQIYLGGEQDVLTQESIHKMTSQQIDIGRGGSIHACGYGLGVGDRLVGHSGGIVGFKSQFLLDRETQTLIVVFSNNAGTNAADIAFGLLTILFTPET